jgi:hypothetical protein
MYKHCVVADYDHALGPVKPQVKPLVKLQNNIKCQHLLSSNQMNDQKQRTTTTKYSACVKIQTIKSKLIFPFVEVRKS